MRCNLLHLVQDLGVVIAAASVGAIAAVECGPPAASARTLALQVGQAEQEPECCMPERRWGCACRVLCQSISPTCPTPSGIINLTCDDATCEPTTSPPIATCTLNPAYRKANQCELFDTVVVCPTPPAGCPDNTGGLQCEYLEIKHSDSANDNVVQIYTCYSTSWLCTFSYAECD